MLVLLGEHLSSLVLHCRIPKSGLAHFCGVAVGVRGPCAPALFLVATELLSCVAGQGVSAAHGLQPLPASPGGVLLAVDGGQLFPSHFLLVGGGALILLTQAPPLGLGACYAGPHLGYRIWQSPTPRVGWVQLGRRASAFWTTQGTSGASVQGRGDGCGMRRPGFAISCPHHPLLGALVKSTGKPHELGRFGTLCGAVSHQPFLTQAWEMRMIVSNVQISKLKFREGIGSESHNE